MPALEGAKAPLVERIRDPHHSECDTRGCLKPAVPLSFAPPVELSAGDLERWQSGRMRRIRNPVYGFAVTWVRIPPSPPNWFHPSPNGWESNPRNQIEGFDKSAGCRFVQRSCPKGEAQDVPSTSTSPPYGFTPAPTGGSRTHVINMMGSTNRQAADLCSEAARRARHRMCRVHPALSATILFQDARKPRSATFPASASKR